MMNQRRTSNVDELYKSSMDCFIRVSNFFNTLFFFNFYFYTLSEIIIFFFKFYSAFLWQQFSCNNGLFQKKNLPCWGYRFLWSWPLAPGFSVKFTITPLEFSIFLHWPPGNPCLNKIISRNKIYYVSTYWSLIYSYQVVDRTIIS